MANDANAPGCCARILKLTHRSLSLMPTALFVTAILVLIGLVLLLGGSYFLIYWRLIQRPVPRLDGALTLPCLEQPVQVLRDKHAVPHLYAQSRADLFRAQGYVHAQDRLWQMEQQRRVGRGTLAEVFGSAALDADRFSRIIGLRRAAEAEVAAFDAETRQVLDWYAEGVNAFIAANPGTLSAEFNLLRVQPELWGAVDSVLFAKVMGWALSINWESELIRLRLVEGLGEVRAAELEPDYPAGAPVVLEGVGSAEATRLLHTAGLLLNQYEGVKRWLGNDGGGMGSNSWVLAPSRSLSGRPLLCADPHLVLQIPGVWYENALHCPGFDVSGASFPGAPGVVMGHNESIAWGMTNAYVDVQDLYLERAHPDDATLFRYGEGWEQAQVHDEEIVVRRAASHVERVIVTRHGPLINRLVSGTPLAHDTPLALRWVGAEPGGTIRAILKLNEAQSWDEFQAAVAGWAAPPQNITYAHVNGDIGYVLAGAIPLRDKNLGLVPAPGWSGEHEWSGLIPPAELPRLFNPPSGLIVTANNKIVGDEYPYFLGVEFFPGWRAARLEALLAKQEQHTVRDMEEMQLDTGSAFAEALVPRLTLLNSDDAWERFALKAFKTWNYRMEPDSAAALVFHYLLLHLQEMVYGDKLGPLKEGYLGISTNPLFLIHGFVGRADTHLLHLLSSQAESPWYTEMATGRRRRREELLQEALTKAVRAIRKQIGDSTRKWDWGRSHQIRYVHSLGSARFLRTFFNRGPFPIGGDGSTPLQTRHAPRLPLGLVQVTPSYRQIYEVGNWDRAESVTTAGQSGHPLSDFYADQISMFREGAYHPMAWTRPAVEAAAIHRQTLRPPADEGEKRTSAALPADDPR